MMDNPLYYLKIKNTDCIMFAGINDLFLVDSEMSGDVDITYPVNEWILAGENKLSLLIDWPESEPFEPDKAKLEASLFIHDGVSNTPTPGETIIELNWPEPPEFPEEFPTTLQLPFEVESPPPHQFYEECANINQLTFSDRESIINITNTLRSAILSADTETLEDLLSYRYLDEARAQYKGGDGLLTTVVQQFTGLGDMLGQFDVSEVSIEQASFELLYNNRLVKLMIDKRHPLLIYADSRQYLFAGVGLYFGRVEGKWCIVR